MTEKCFDIGTIQAFLDGELSLEMVDNVAQHIGICDDCAILMADAEEETAFAFSALEQEFNTLVPTQRLWTKINDSIEKERKPFWSQVFAFLLQPSTAAFASLLFVAVVSISLLTLKPNAPTNYVAINNQPKQIVSESAKNTVVPVPTAENSDDFVESVEENTKTVVNHIPRRNEVRIEKAAYSTAVKPEKIVPAVKSFEAKADVVAPTPRENVLGEESYIKTIATLTETVKNRKDEVLNPSARFAFERDLAMTEDAIKRMKKEVNKNPNNEAARQILRASYQNKIDLLNSVADKTELMASLK